MPLPHFFSALVSVLVSVVVVVVSVAGFAASPVGAAASPSAITTEVERNPAITAPRTNLDHWFMVWPFFIVSKLPLLMNDVMRSPPPSKEGNPANGARRDRNLLRSELEKQAGKS